MITASATDLFPRCPTYGFTSRPAYRVKMVEREDGTERRDRKWAQSLSIYEAVPLGNQSERDMETIYNFFHAQGGTAYRFRFKDWIDYKSCNIADDPAAGDQPFVLIDGSPGSYAMYKTYTSTNRTTLRRIFHPKGDTITVKNNSGAVQDPSKWTIDEDTGIIVPEPTFAGIPATWGGEFYVPARFAADIQIEISDFKIHSLTASLRELRSIDQ